MTDRDEALVRAALERAAGACDEEARQCNLGISQAVAREHYSNAATLSTDYAQARNLARTIRALDPREIVESVKEADDAGA